MRKFKYANLFLIVLLVSSILAACKPNWEEITQQRDDLVSRFGIEATRMEDSKTEVSNRSGDFPYAYTQATESQLAAAKVALTNIGSDSSGWLGELNDAIQKRDKKTAIDLMDKIQPALDTISVYTNQILGPPGSIDQTLYDILDRKVALLHDGYVKGDDERDLLAEIKDLDATTLVSIQAAVPFALCESQTQMSYKDAKASYGTGVSYIRNAEKLISEGDQPAASDALVEAMHELSAATGAINSASANHQLVINAIDAAELSQKIAIAAILVGYGDYPQHEANEYSAGEDSLENAYALCYTETFVSADIFAVTAMTEANSAKDHFDKATWWTTEEEEEVVINTSPADDGETIDPWSYDFDEADVDVPNDSPTWEFESNDSPTWEYESNDSPSWEFESNDDTWEFESNDSPTWEYESDDSSSWDEAIWLSPKFFQPLSEWIQQR